MCGLAPGRAGWLAAGCRFGAAQGEAPAAQTQVMPLKYARATELKPVLSPLYRDTAGVLLGVDERTNTLIVSAAPAVLAEIAKLVRTLDAAAGSAPDDRNDFYVLPLKQLEPDQKLVEALQLLIPNAKAGRFIVDPGAKLLLVQGPPALERAVKDLLMRLELAGTPPPLAGKGLQVRLLCLVGGKLAKGDSMPAAVFADLADELKLLRLDPMRIAAQTLVQVTPAAAFAVSGGATLDGACVVKFSGKVRNLNDGTFGLDVTVTAVEAGKGASARLCDLQTELRVPLGKLVLLGSAPVRGEPTAFLVQVAEAGAAKLPEKKAAVTVKPRKR